MAAASASSASSVPFDGELGDLTPEKAAPAAPNVEFNLCTPDPGTMDAAKARYLAGAILDGSRTHYTKARLGTWAHCEESMEVFGEALARCPGLTSVDLGDIVASRMEAEAVKTYKMLADKLAVHRGRLKALDFSYNAVGPTGLKALRGLLEEQESLEELVMVACGVSAEAQEELTELLLFRDAKAGAEAGPAMTRLRRLVFDNNLAGAGGAAAMGRLLRQSPALEELQFTGARVPGEGGRALISALLALPRPALTRLDLHDNIFGSSCGAELAGLLAPAALPALQDLNLAYLGIGDAETAELCRSLLGVTEGGASRAAGAAERCGRLRQLRLGGNDLEADGAAAPLLAALLVGLPALEELHLDDNELGSAVRWLGAGVAARAKLLGAGAAPLRVLDVGSNMAHTKALKAVVDAAVAAGGVQSVEIGGNYVDEADAAAWATAAVAVTSDSAELEPAEEEEEAEAEAAFEGCGEDTIPFLGLLGPAGGDGVDALAAAVAGMSLAAAAPGAE